MKIANIIYEDNLVNHSRLDYINYINEPIKYKEIDTSLVTLFVGWRFMKKCNPDSDILQNGDILDKKIIKNKLYWEFDFTEKKSDHVSGIEKFVNLVPEYYFLNKYSYINVDPIFLRLKYMDDLVYYIPNNITNVYIFKREMIYFLIKNDVYGMNLNIFDYFKFNVDDLIEIMTNRGKDKICNDIEGKEHEKFYKTFPNFKYLKRYIVTML